MDLLYLEPIYLSTYTALIIVGLYVEYVLLVVNGGVSGEMVEYVFLVVHGVSGKWFSSEFFIRANSR